jgi:hypothetical protein
MVAQLTCRFPSKHNGNGSHDSICISCFASVASVRNEANWRSVSKIIFAIALLNHVS